MPSEPKAGGTHAITPEQIAMALQLFPVLAGFKKLQDKLTAIECKRVGLIASKPAMNECEMEVEIHNTSKLNKDIVIFQQERVVAFKLLEVEITDASAMINDIEQGRKLANAEAVAQTIRDGGMAPAASRAQDWESDTNTGDNLPEDEEMQLAVQTQLEKMNESRERLNYECTLHGMMQKLQHDFAINTQLEGVELRTFVFSNEDDEVMRLNCLPLCDSLPLMNTFVKTAVNAALQRLGHPQIPSQQHPMAADGVQGSPDKKNQPEEVWNADEVHDIFMATDSDKPSASAVNEDWYTGPREPCFTCGEEGHVSKDCRDPDIPSETEVQYTAKVEPSRKQETSSTKLWEMKNVYCENCSMFGHDKPYCSQLFPEEERPNFCDVCKRYGHVEDGCWRLHPELKKKYLEEQRLKEKKLRCHECSRMGHARRFCPKLHHRN